MLRLFTHDEIIAALHAFPDASQRPLPGFTEHQTKAFETLHEHDPEMIPLVAELASTGSITSRETATNILAVHIRTILEMVTTPVPTKVVDWNAAARRAIPRYSKTDRHNELFFRWNYYNVAHEVGTDEDMFKGYNLRGRAFLKHFSSATRAQSRNDAYWRGVSALFLSMDREQELTNHNAHLTQPFITWAGEHHDIGAVIRLASERATTDVETLRYLMEDGNKHSALGSGLL